MAKVKVGINGFGRIGRNLFRAAHEAGAEHRVRRRQRPHRRRDARPPAQVRLDPRPLPRRGRGRRGLARGRRRRDQGALRARPGGARLGRPRCRRRDRVDRLLHQARRRRQAPRRRRQEGDHLRSGHRPRRHRRPRRQLRERLRPRQPPHHLERLLHDQLPGAGGEGDQRRGRDRARTDDHDPRLHGRSAPSGHAAQGPAPRPRRGAQPDPDLDRRREGRRPGPAGAERQAERDGGPRPGRHRLGRRPDLRRLEADQRRGDQRRGAGGGRGAARRDPRLHRGPDRLHRHRQGPALVDLRRRADDRDGGRLRQGLLPGTTTSGATRTGSSSSPGRVLEHEPAVA